MKINLSDYISSRRPIYCSEDQLTYDDPLTKSEELWNKLSVYYEKKYLADNMDTLKESEFQHLINLCKVENDIAITTLGLIPRNVIKMYKTEESKEETVNIKLYILKQINEILLKRKIEFLENVQDEKKFYKRITDVFNDITYEDGIVKICYDNINYINYSEIINDQKYNLNGISCIIRFKGLEFVYGRKLECKNEFERIKEYFFEKTIVQKYKKGYLDIEIVNHVINGENELCKALIQEIANGKQIDDLFSILIIGICRYVLNKLLQNYKIIKIIPGSTLIKEDGRPDIYFIRADNDIYKVSYTKDSFNIYLNGNIIKFESVL